jgi:hypothetical protein
VRAGLHHVLAVVQNEQELAGLEGIREGLGERAARRLAQAQRPGHALRDERRLRQRRQLHHPDPIRVVLEELSGELQGQTGLAAAGRPREREQPRARQQAPQLVDLALPADEARRLERQVVGQELQRAERREVARQPRVQQLIDLLRPLQVLETGLAQVPQRGSVREAVAHQVVDRLREEGLAPVADREQPGGAVQDRTEVVALPLLGGSGVKRHAGPQRARLAPFFGGERELGFQSGGERLRRPLESHGEGVSAGLEDAPPVTRDRLAQELIVAGDRTAHGLGMLLPLPRTAPRGR